MITCTRRLQFCAGHRVLGHENKCAQPHGHNYVAEITAQASLDSVGRVVDFSVIKERVGGWIEENWDHGFILYSADAHLRNCLQAFGGCGERLKLFVMSANPTAENMAEFLLRQSNELLQDAGVRVVHVRLYETENCWAEAKEDRA